jgi:hypothetical protein
MVVDDGHYRRDRPGLWRADGVADRRTDSAAGHDRATRHNRTT